MICFPKDSDTLISYEIYLPWRYWENLDREIDNRTLENKSGITYGKLIDDW